MKKTSLLLVTASIAFITMQSCKKQEQPQEQEPITQTVDATVKVNETYSYTLPAGEGPEAYTIIKQSEHSGSSTIEKNAAGNFIYRYTPTTGFTGTDVIILSDAKEGHRTCNHADCNHKEHPDKLFRHGSCQHDRRQNHIVTINFTIAEATFSETSQEIYK